MKSRLSSTIWTLVFLNGVAFVVVLVLAFGAGKKAGEASGFDVSSPGVVGALLVALVTTVIIVWRLLALVGPVQALAQFSARLAAGDPRAQPAGNATHELDSNADNPTH